MLGKPATGLALAYSRVSTYEQLSGGNLEDHAKILTALAARYGLELVGPPVLEQGSGDLEYLGGLRGILDDVRHGRNVWRVLLVKEFSRLGRSFFEVFDSLKILTDGGVRVIAADGLDTDNPLWKPFAAMLAYYAESERQRIRERTMGGRLARLTRGLHVLSAPAPVGFRKVGRGKDAYIEVDPAEARMLRRAYDLIVYDRLPAHNAALILRREGYTSRTGKPLTAGLLRAYLDNERLAGRWIYNRYQGGTKQRQKARREGKEVAKFRPREEWITLEGPRIFSDEEWAALQTALSQRARALARRADAFPLTSHITCENCAPRAVSPVYRQQSYVSKRTGERRDYPPSRGYLCKHCGAYHNAPAVEAMLLDEVWNTLRSPEARRELLERYAERRETRVLDISAELGELEAQLEDLREQRRRYQRLYASGRMTDREYDEAVTPINRSMGELDARASALRVERDARIAAGVRAQDMAGVLAFDMPEHPPEGALFAIAHNLDLWVTVGKRKGKSVVVSVQYRALEGLAEDSSNLELRARFWVRRKSAGLVQAGDFPRYGPQRTGRSPVKR